MSWLTKLLAIVALLTTSIGMTAATAAANPHHRAAAEMAMPMEHCPDADGADTGGGVPECAMACAAALPAAELAQPHPLTSLCAPDQGLLAGSLQGLHPDTATPPPKAS